MIGVQRSPQLSLLTVAVTPSLYQKALKTGGGCLRWAEIIPRVNSLWEAYNSNNNNTLTVIQPTQILPGGLDVYTLGSHPSLVQPACLLLVVVGTVTVRMTDVNHFVLTHTGYQ